MIYGGGHLMVPASINRFLTEGIPTALMMMLVVYNRVLMSYQYFRLASDFLHRVFIWVIHNLWMIK